MGIIYGKSMVDAKKEKLDRLANGSVVQCTLAMNKLNHEQKLQVEMMMSGEKKSVTTYRLLSLISCHYIYTGEIGKFLLYIFAAIAGCWLACIPTAIMFIYALVTARKKIDRVNAKKRLEIMTHLGFIDPMGGHL